MKRTLLLIIALSTTAAGFVPVLAGVAHAEPTPSARVTLRIQGMVGPSCPVLVKAAVGKIPGVTRVQADYESKSATVDYEPTKTSPAAIQRVIKDQVGFDSTVVP